MGPLIGLLCKNKGPEDSLWGIRGADLIRIFKLTCESLSLNILTPCRHALRHGGASDDLVTRTRSLGEVKKRGLWAADSSLTRYGKETAMLQQLNRLRPEVLVYGQKVAPIISEILARRRPAPVPPISPADLLALKSLV